MRKRFWVAIVLLALTLGLNAYVYYAMDSIHGYFTKETDTIIEAIKKDDYETAEKVAERLVGEWEERSKSINLHVSHRATHEIEARFIALKEYIVNRGPGDALTFAEQIKSELLLLKESEIPYLYNLL